MKTTATETITYVLRQATDGTFAWFAPGHDRPWPLERTPDMQLLGWAPEETDALLKAAQTWISERGLDAKVIVA